jgi:hypothetical protein
VWGGRGSLSCLDSGKRDSESWLNFFLSVFVGVWEQVSTAGLYNSAGSPRGEHVGFGGMSGPPCQNTKEEVWGEGPSFGRAPRG